MSDADTIEQLRLALTEARTALTNLEAAKAEVTERLQMDIAGLTADFNTEDKALLDWADKTGHHHATYRSLRDELRDRARLLPQGLRALAGAAESSIARRVMLERLNSRKSTMFLDDYTVIQRFIGTVI